MPKHFCAICRDVIQLVDDFMTYDETVHYLYTCMPAYEHLGPSAYKPGLDTSIALDDLLENPHRDYKTIHVAGTNGKGSVCHLLAAILQQAGYKVGLYTSPHLVDFRERIRVNGQMISKEFVIDFVERYSSLFEPFKPSFFELTSSLAFDYFRSMNVDIAVIETGLGGRLDSTNIISPILSIITNISLDHMQFLGNTEEQIAFEKAGIIKENTPIVIGEVYKDTVARVFKDKAKQLHAPITFAQDGGHIFDYTLLDNGKWLLNTSDYGDVCDELGGSVQYKNAITVFEAIKQLKQLGFQIADNMVRAGFEHVIEQTGLMGRWQILQDKPRIICDTGHNIGGWQYLGKQLKEEAEHYKHLLMIIGMMADKDVDGVLKLMPPKAIYFFTQAATDRAMKAETFAEKGAAHGLKGYTCQTVGEALKLAQQSASKEDMIFIGGSTYIVAEALPLLHQEKYN